MFDLHLPSKYGLIAGPFLALCVPFFFIILKTLSRQREEHRLVRNLVEVPPDTFSILG